VKTSGCAHGALGRLRQGAIFILLKTVAYGKIINHNRVGRFNTACLWQRSKRINEWRDTEDWAAELWSMFGGSMIAQKELGYSPEISNTFFSFRDLLFFFEKIDKIRNDG
jgi:hypothetical protein